ncbi:3'-5' exoribonuclease [Streptomyces anulatus]|uniref:3'-5' exoribonuclease n=1 Tax=Streptomyces anulatus TaxID=1892 RepID=UPI001C281006|nr:3'-5' exoribonuclease [Streptomyces anulatus]
MLPAPNDIYADCEFIRHDMSTRGLISVGITDRAGHDYYAVNADMDEQYILHSTDETAVWLRQHVWPLLPLTTDHALDRAHPDVKTTDRIRQEIAAYYASRTGARMWAYFGAGDLIRIHGLWDHDWGRMPDGVPYRHRELADLIEDFRLTVPAQQTPAHHALNDAHYNRLMHDVALSELAAVAAINDGPRQDHAALVELVTNCLARSTTPGRGRTTAELIKVMPDWLAADIDAHEPGLAALHGNALLARRRYEQNLTEWINTVAGQNPGPQ